MKKTDIIGRNIARAMTPGGFAPKRPSHHTAACKLRITAEDSFVGRQEKKRQTKIS